jgi:hypothetical protein
MTTGHEKSRCCYLYSNALLCHFLEGVKNSGQPVSRFVGPYLSVCPPCYVYLFIYLFIGVCLLFVYVDVSIYPRRCCELIRRSSCMQVKFRVMTACLHTVLEIFLTPWILQNMEFMQEQFTAFVSV